ncbi:MAG: Na(+)/H(+) antiporter NhaA, partial [Gammaproteobacteria bacterium]|nr:Na(+)/H(+) antiporter NhaA [Gammaproteobacteria bacterium]
MIKALLKSDAGAGTLLVLSAVVALVIANSPLAAAYEHLLESDLRLGIGPLALTKTVLHWINDGLMAVFFMVVGLEIKRELVVGELSDRRRAALPVFGALGGMIAPALVYLAV